MCSLAGGGVAVGGRGEYPHLVLTGDTPFQSQPGGTPSSVDGGLGGILIQCQEGLSPLGYPYPGVSPSQTDGGTPDQLDGGTPEMLTDIHLWKQYLPIPCWYSHFNGQNLLRNFINIFRLTEISGVYRCLTQLHCDGYSSAMWLKFTQSALEVAGNKAVFSSGGQGNASVTIGGVALLINQGRLILRFKRNIPSRTTWDVDGDISTRGEQWVHVAGTWTAAGTAKLYLDGGLNATGYQQTFFPFSQYLPPVIHVGKLNDAGAHAEFVLDEWYFWDWELSGDQLAQVYEAYQTGISVFQISFISTFHELSVSRA